jgi:hypothetical protein
MAVSRRAEREDFNGLDGRAGVDAGSSLDLIRLHGARKHRVPHVDIRGSVH